MSYVDQMIKAINPLPIEMHRVGLFFDCIQEEDDYTNFILVNQKSNVNIKICLNSKSGSISTFIKFSDEKFWHLRRYFIKFRSEDEYNELFFNKNPKEYIANFCKILDSQLGLIIMGLEDVEIEFDWMGYK